MKIRSLAAALVLSVTALGGCASETDADDEQVVEGEDELNQAAFTPKPSRHPIVLAHGFSAAATKPLWGFYKVTETLEADGHVVTSGDVSPFKPISVRARDLGRIVDSAQALCRTKRGCDASKVHVIAHSMGGLDARYMISKLGYGDRIASLTTVASPHRGTAIADAALRFVPRDENAMGKALNGMLDLFGRMMTDDALANDSDLRAALESISEKYVNETFNREVKDDPRVTYLSYASVSNIMGIPNPKDDDLCEGTFKPKNGRDRMNALLVPIAPIVAHGWKLDPNDGMATVASAKWGKFLGCLAADHVDQVGQPRHDTPNKHGGFDHFDFYRRLASRLDDEVAEHGR